MVGLTIDCGVFPSVLAKFRPAIVALESLVAHANYHVQPIARNHIRARANCEHLQRSSQHPRPQHVCSQVHLPQTLPIH